ncbi:hypothetical protein [Aliarcobacter butzleri]|uniref:hypothetical protein n=1 Tax=Aliarcobacter butzleri TaxID=28197 RepID=UPI0021B43A2A|nr:hypothetical protein [Aliarcobacter butzleri]MCT7595775.1 hypothetical protein [Aliarcobacter butzleri]MCT7600279.1 hypothetical protein [Aliarcobacter butzleri]
MNSKQIAIKYIGQKINNPKIIFEDLNIFKSILFWSRDAAKEYFSTKPTKYFLVYYIDDVAHVVDEYMLSRIEKIYKQALRKKNKLFYNLYSSEKTISWLIDRWINTFVNITSNEKYKDFVDITKIKMNFHDDIYKNSKNIDDLIEFEKIKKLSKEEKIKLLKEVWEQAYYDNFDEYDMQYLLEKLDLTMDEIFEHKEDLIKLNLKKEQAESGNSQLVLIF